MKTTVVLVAALLSGSAFGACKDAEWMDRPETPNGQEATREQMLDARDAVTQYVRGGEAYLNCVNPDPYVYNHLVGRLESSARQFNRELKHFRQQQMADTAN